MVSYKWKLSWPLSGIWPVTVEKWSWGQCKISLSVKPTCNKTHLKSSTIVICYWWFYDTIKLHVHYYKGVTIEDVFKRKRALSTVLVYGTLSLWYYIYMWTVLLLIISPPPITTHKFSHIFEILFLQEKLVHDQEKRRQLQEIQTLRDQIVAGEVTLPHLFTFL